jgi:hypothetical protein
MGLHKLRYLRFHGAILEVVQKRLIRIHGMDHDAKLPGKGQRLTARTATGINDESKLLFRKKTQSAQRMSVAAWTKFLEPTEKQANRIRGVHRLFVC